jgi:hypothetical protein
MEQGNAVPQPEKPKGAPSTFIVLTAMLCLSVLLNVLLA